ncbi:hypothetical protein, partial [Bifidobacterium pseudocatenulatum]|uniref:hypothetical protein n=1 Tax=Bifidobacterium pseudocatenulatum TaxID=28026 RepID=UPI0022E1DDE4
CVKHAASVHPEPESNPPQKKFMERHRIDDSQNKKIDDRLIRKGASHENLTSQPGNHSPSGSEESIYTNPGDHANRPFQRYPKTVANKHIPRRVPIPSI